MRIGGLQDTIWEATMLVLLMEAIYEVHPWDGIRWHDIHTKFHEDYTSNIKVITSKFLVTAMLVLLLGGIYEVRRWDGIGCHDIHTKFRKESLSNLKVSWGIRIQSTITHRQ
jgi:hypothetical protein